MTLSHLNCSLAHLDFRGLSFALLTLCFVLCALCSERSVALCFPNRASHMYIHTYIHVRLRVLCTSLYIIVHVPPRQHRKNAAVRARTAYMHTCMYVYTVPAIRAWGVGVEYMYITTYCDISHWQ